VDICIQYVDEAIRGKNGVKLCM